jgi:1,4-dihydroxy-2-naphthoate octaprenyltransferase
MSLLFPPAIWKMRVSRSSADSECFSLNFHHCLFIVTYHFTLVFLICVERQLPSDIFTLIRLITTKSAKILLQNGVKYQSSPHNAF